ncbi:9570_t:CDS:2 [Ambispora leptoticha]|uniref:9570_t:CDS:1 n=1 Tax=Ambispora leptoticha TaxID=144679 RepID=A0A9N9BGE1_9GLOM|nr:9570_t:CDS:2 [Ambispora leptoticha]
MYANLRRKSMKTSKNQQVVKLPNAGLIAVEKLLNDEEKVEIEARAERQIEQEKQLRELTTKPDVYQVLPYTDENKCIVKYPTKNNNEQHIANTLDTDTMIGKKPTVTPEFNRNYQFQFPPQDNNDLSSRSINEFSPRNNNELSVSSSLFASNSSSSRNENEFTALSLSSFTSNSSFPNISNLISSTRKNNMITSSPIDAATNIDNKIDDNTLQRDDPEGMKKPVNSNNFKGKDKRFQETKGKMPMDQSIFNSSNKNTAQYSFISNNFEAASTNSDAFLEKFSREVAARVEHDMELRLSNFFSDVKGSLLHEISNKLQKVLPSSYDEKKKEEKRRDYEWINVEEAKLEKLRDELIHEIKTGQRDIASLFTNHLKNQHTVENVELMSENAKWPERNRTELHQSHFSLDLQRKDSSSYSSLENDLMQAREEVYNLNRESENKIRALENQIKTYEHELTTLRLENQSKERDLYDRNKKLEEEIMSKEDSYLTKCHEYEQQLSEQSSLIEKNEQRIDALLQENTKLRDKNKEIEKNRAELTSLRVRESGSSQTEITRLQDQKSALEAKVGQLTSRNQELQNEIRGLGHHIKRMEEQTTQLESMCLHVNQLEQNSNEFERLKKFSSDQQRELDQARTLIQRLENESKENVNRIKDLERMYNQSRSDVDLHKSELELVRKHNRELAEDLSAEQNKKINDALHIKQESEKNRQQLANKAEELNKVRSELNEVYAKLKDVEAQKTRLQRENNKIANLEKERTKLLENIKNIELEKNHLQIEMQRVVTEKMQLETEISRLTSAPAPTPFASTQPVNYNYLSNNNVQTEAMAIPTINSQSPFVSNFLPTTQGDTSGDVLSSANTVNASPFVDERPVSRDELSSETNHAVIVNPQTSASGRKNKFGSQNHSRKNSRQTKTNNDNQKPKSRKNLNYRNGSSSSTTATRSTNNIAANEPSNTAAPVKNSWVDGGSIVNNAWPKTTNSYRSQ